MLTVATDRRAEEDSLVARARDMIPSLRDRAAETEALRRIPDATEQDFRAAGFYRVMQPKRYGGAELPYGAHTRLAWQVGRGCVSSAWALSVTACHSWILGMFPRRAQDEFWGDTPEATVASTFLSVGHEATPEGDGLHLKGRWRFSSNVDQCQGCIVIVMQPRKDAPPLQYFALLYREDYEVEATWDVAGLAGTGSNDVVVSGVHVPAHRLLDVMTTRDASTPGSRDNPGDLYNMPLFAPFAHSLVGAAIGGAQGMLDLLLEDLVDKRSAAGAKLAAQQSAQLRIAEATAEISAARALIATDRSRILAFAADRQLPTDEERVSLRLNTGYAAKLSVQAVERLLPLTGGRGLERNSPYQRFWRDVHAVAQHIALVWDVQALNYGGVRLGFKAMDPRI